jgi:formylglycine-generating enzyme required for sulfatase activity
MTHTTALSPGERALACIGAAILAGCVVVAVMGNRDDSRQLTIYNLRAPALWAADQMGVVQLTLTLPATAPTQDSRIPPGALMQMTSNGRASAPPLTIDPIGALIEVKIGDAPWTAVHAAGVQSDGFCPLRNGRKTIAFETTEPWVRHAFRARVVVRAAGAPDDQPAPGDVPPFARSLLVYPGVYSRQPVPWSALDDALQRHHHGEGDPSWPFRDGISTGPGTSGLAAGEIAYVSDASDEQIMTPTSSIRFALLKTIADPSDPTAIGAELLVTRLIGDAQGHDARWLAEPIKYELQRSGDPLSFEEAVPDPHHGTKKMEVAFATPFVLLEVKQDVKRIEFYAIRSVARAAGGPDKDLTVMAKEIRTDIAVLRSASGQTVTLVKLGRIQRPPHPAAIIYPSIPTMLYDERAEFSQNPAYFRQWGLCPPPPIMHPPGTGPLEFWRIKSSNPRLRTDTEYVELADGRLIYWDAVSKAVATYCLPDSESRNGVELPVIPTITDITPAPSAPLDQWPSPIGRDQYGYWSDLRVGRTTQRMRWLAPGSFIMGSPVGEPHRRRDEDQHAVTVSTGFWIADTPCTQDLWRTVTDANPSHFSSHRQSPVEEVSQDDIAEFLTVLHRRLGAVFALPTEAEREYACRAGTVSAYPGHFLDAWNMYDVDAMGWYEGNSWGRTHDVHGKLPNPWGLYDMQGNVWEWCSDWIGDYPRDAVTDPHGPDHGVEKVLRGGSWDSPEWYCRSAQRWSALPNSRSRNIGFRFCIRDADRHRMPPTLSPTVDGGAVTH